MQQPGARGVEDDVSTRAIAEAIGRGLDVPVVRIAADDAEDHFGPFAMLMSLDFPPMTSEETRALLGWEPTHSGLIADLDAGHYFETDWRPLVTSEAAAATPGGRCP